MKNVHRFIKKKHLEKEGEKKGGVKKEKKGHKDERQDEGGWRLNGYATKVTKM